MFEEDADASSQIRMLARQAKVPILVGSDQVERGPGASFKYYNSAFLVRADGTSGAAYRKMHLVPFGEYVPLKRLLFFAAPLVEAVVRFLRRRGRGAAAGRAATWSAPPSATKSSIPIWCGSSSSAAARC